MPPFNASPVTLRKESAVSTIPSAHVKASQLNMSMIEADDRSVYVGNVDYAATPEDLEEHFHGCGPINRVTILGNKFDGHPKGFAYIEFGDKDSVQAAMALNESLFKGRQIKVMPKRTNKPGLSTTNRPPRAMRGRGRSFRGGFSPHHSRFSPYYSGFSTNYSGFSTKYSGFSTNYSGFSTKYSGFSTKYSGFSPNYSGYRPVRRGRNNPYVYVNNTASKK